jgi:hypothetical protein
MGTLDFDAITIEEWGQALEKAKQQGPQAQWALHQAYEAHRKERERTASLAHAQEEQWTSLVALSTLVGGLSACFYFFGFVHTALGIIILLLIGLVGHTTEML